MKGNLTMKALKHKTLFFTLLLSMLFSQSSFAQYFLKSYDYPPFTTRTDVARSIEQVNTTVVSSNWSVAGFSNSTPSGGDYDWMYLKLNSSGSVICTSLLGFPLGDSCFSHAQFRDASMRAVLSGFYRAPNGYEKASWSMLDSNCFHILSKQIADTSRHQYRAITINPATNAFTNAGFIRFPMGGSVPNKILVTQYTSAGIMSWGFKYISMMPSTDEAYSVCYQPADGSYAVAGRTNHPAGAGFNVIVVKLSPAGFPLWNKIYKFPGLMPNSNAYKIIPMPDGGFVIAGWTNAFDPSNDAWIFRINAAGFPVWSMLYGLPGVSEQAFSIVYNSADGSLAFTGHTTIGGSEDILFGKLSAATGAPITFTKYPNPAGSDRGYDIENALIPAGYGLTGQVFAPPSTSLDPFLMRTDALGRVTPGCLDTIPLQPRPVQHVYDSLFFNYMPVQDIPVQPQVIHPSVAVRNLCVITGTSGNETYIPKEYSLKQNYPNPFNPSTKIEFSLPVDGKISIKIFDAAGKEVAVLINEHKNKGNYSLQFNASNLPSGVYFYRLQAGDYLETKKMILLK